MANGCQTTPMDVFSCILAYKSIANNTRSFICDALFLHEAIFLHISTVGSSSYIFSMNVHMYSVVFLTSSESVEIEKYMLHTVASKWSIKKSLYKAEHSSTRKLQSDS